MVSDHSPPCFVHIVKCSSFLLLNIKYLRVGVCLELEQLLHARLLAKTRRAVQRLRGIGVGKDNKF